MKREEKRSSVAVTAVYTDPHVTLSLSLSTALSVSRLEDHCCGACCRKLHTYTHTRAWIFLENYKAAERKAGLH